MRTPSGFTLIEVLIAVFLLAVGAIAITGLITLGTRLAFESQRQVVAQALVNEKIEHIRSLKYDDVGYSNAAGNEPNGVLTRQETVTRNQQPYDVTTTVELIDNPDNNSSSEGSPSPPRLVSHLPLDEGTNLNYSYPNQELTSAWKTSDVASGGVAYVSNIESDDWQSSNKASVQFPNKASLRLNNDNPATRQEYFSEGPMPMDFKTVGAKHTVAFWMNKYGLGGIPFWMNGPFTFAFTNNCFGVISSPTGIQGGQVRGVPSTAISNNAWIHVAAIFVNGNGTTNQLQDLYINGKEPATFGISPCDAPGFVPTNFLSTQETFNLYWGGGSEDSDFIARQFSQANFDDVRIYEGELSPNQIASLACGNDDIDTPCPGSSSSTPVYSLNEANADYKTVKVEAKWTSAGGAQRDVSVTTIVSPPDALTSCTPGVTNVCSGGVTCPSNGLCPAPRPSPYCPSGAYYCP